LSEREREAVSVGRCGRKSESRKGGEKERAREGLGRVFLEAAFADDCLEACLDGSDRPRGATRTAFEEVHAVLSLHGGVGALARLADHVLRDVVTQNGLDLLLLESAFDDELLLGVQAAGRTHFGQRVLHHVLVLSSHLVTNVRKIRPHSFPCSFLSNKRGWDFNALVLLT
jgi:hypothetical protein